MDTIDSMFENFPWTKNLNADANVKDANVEVVQIVIQLRCRISV